MTDKIKLPRPYDTMKHAAYHRDGEMIPLSFELTGLDQAECFVMHLNHRDYPLHATEVLDMFGKCRDALMEWLTTMPAEYLPFVFNSNSGLEEFYNAHK